MLDLLGLPDSDEALMRHWSDRCSNFLFQPVAPDKEAMAREQREILDAQQAYFMPRIEERRRRPGEDMISAMAQAEAGGERLTDLEILATCNMMATAGGGTSRSAIAMSLWWLHQFPDQLAKLKADPSLINLAAEEFLRYDAPTQRGIRTAREDFEIGGKQIRKGQLLHIMIGAANRDPAQFARPGPDRHHPRSQPPRDARPRRALLSRRGTGAARTARRGGELSDTLSGLPSRQRQDRLHGPHREPAPDRACRYSRVRRSSRTSISALVAEDGYLLPPGHRVPFLLPLARREPLGKDRMGHAGALASLLLGLRLKF